MGVQNGVNIKWKSPLYPSLALGKGGRGGGVGGFK